MVRELGDQRMNKDLISRNALLELAHNHVGGTVDCNDIARFPAVDAEVVRHGRWIPRGGRFRCSECDAKALWSDAGGTGGFSHEWVQVCAKYCHICGAKMDAEVQDVPQD